MEEKHIGAYMRDVSFEREEDCELYDETACYKVHTSKAKESVVIHTSDYHPGDLYLSKSDLENLLKKISQ
ncbi:hypothetical protein GF336_02245 [Candidatus Woesearchaeota archaeon]|nr:hypothetical protein [Candidatus Woesearchaeota archaeon]